MNTTNFPSYIIHPKTDKATWDTQGVTSLVRGLSRIHRKIVLESAWTEYAKAGYGEGVIQTTRMLRMNEKDLKQAARELAYYRPTMAWWFCQKFLDAKIAVEILTKFIKLFEEEEKQGITVNSRRFLGQLRQHLDEAKRAAQ
jgi:hypothetical protein